MRIRLQKIASVLACLALLSAAAAYADAWKTEGKYTPKVMLRDYSDPKHTKYDPANNVLYLDDNSRGQFKVEFRTDPDGIRRAYFPHGGRVDTRVKSHVTGEVSLEQAIFVMDAEGNFFVIMDGWIPWPPDMEKVPRLHHSTIPAGQPTAAAGHIMVEDGVIKRLDNNSGHYHPENLYLVQAIKGLEDNGVPKGNYEVDFIFHDPVHPTYLALDPFGREKLRTGDILPYAGDDGPDVARRQPPDGPRVGPGDDRGLLTPDEPTPIPQLDVDRRAQEPAPAPTVTEAAKPVDPPDPSIAKLIRQRIETTPAADMGIAFMQEIYAMDPKAAKVVGQILADTSLHAQNEKMGELRKQMDLEVWKDILKRRGIKVEITNQGKSNGARSDLDYTLYYLAEEAGISIKDLIDEHGKTWQALHKITPDRLEIKVMNGDEFYPDWRNEALSEAEHQLVVKSLLGQLRADPEKYSVPGANKQQVHNRALRDGWTEMLAYDPRLDKPGIPIGEQIIRRAGLTREMAVRYRGVHPQYNHMNALGNLIQNKGEFLHHSGDNAQDAVRRSKYFNRVINEGLGNLRFFANDYKQIYDSDLPNREAQKLAYLEKTLGLLKDDNGKPLIDAAQLRKFRDIIDVSMRIELDKTGDRTGAKADYTDRRAEYFKDYKTKAEANVPLTLAPDERAKAVLDEQERMFEVDQKVVMAEAVLAGLRHSVARDLTPEGALRNRVRFDPETQKFVIDDPEAAKKIAFERAVEVALFYELVNSLGDDADPVVKFMKHDMKKRALSTAPSIELAEFYGALDEVGKAEIDKFVAGDPDSKVGRKITDLLEKQQARTLELLIERKKQAIQRAQAKGIVVDPGTVPAEQVRAHIFSGRLALLSPAQRVQFRQAYYALGTQLSGDFKTAFHQNASGLMMGSSAVNLIRAWQTGDPRAMQYAAFTEAINYMPEYIQTPFTVVDLLAKVHRGEYVGAVWQGSLFAAMRQWPGLGNAMLGYNIATGLLDIGHSHFVTRIDVDLTEQALRSRPRDENGGPLRDGVRARPNRFPDAKESVYNGSGPGFPLFYGRYKNEHAIAPILVDGEKYSDGRVPEDDQSDDELAAAATYEFASQIDSLLTEAGLEPGSDEWRKRAWELKLKYGFDIPFYRRTAKVYQEKYKYITYYDNFPSPYNPEYLSACRLDVYDWYVQQPPGYKLELAGDATFWFGDQSDKMQELIARECAVILGSVRELAQRAEGVNEANLNAFNTAMAKGFDAEHALLAAKAEIAKRIEADEEKRVSALDQKALALAERHKIHFAVTYPFTFATEESEPALEFDIRTLTGVAARKLDIELDQTIIGIKEGAPAAWKPGEDHAAKFKPDAEGWVAYRPVTADLRISAQLVDAEKKPVAHATLDLPVVLYAPSFSGTLVVRVTGATETGEGGDYSEATVTLGAAKRTTDATGTAVFERLPAGSHSVQVAPRKDDERHRGATGSAAVTDALLAKDLKGQGSATVDVILPYIPEAITKKDDKNGKDPGAGQGAEAGSEGGDAAGGPAGKKGSDGTGEEGGDAGVANDPKDPTQKPEDDPALLDPVAAQEGIAAVEAAINRCEYESALVLFEGLLARMGTSPAIVGWADAHLADLFANAEAQRAAREVLVLGQTWIVAGDLDGAIESLREARTLAPACMHPQIDSLIGDLINRRVGGLVRQVDEAELACDYETAEALAQTIAEIEPQEGLVAQWVAANLGRIVQLAANQRAARALMEAADAAADVEDWPVALELAGQALAVPAPDCDAGSIEALIAEAPEDVDDEGEDEPGDEEPGEEDPYGEEPGDEVPEGLMGTERTDDPPPERPVTPSTAITGAAGGERPGQGGGGDRPVPGVIGGPSGGPAGGPGTGGGRTGGTGGGSPGSGGTGGGGSSGGGSGGGQYSSCSECYLQRCAGVCGDAITLLCVVSSGSDECLQCAASCDGLAPPPPTGESSGMYKASDKPAVADYSGTWEVARGNVLDAIMTVRPVDADTYSASPVHQLTQTSSCWRSATTFYVGEITFPEGSLYRQRKGSYEVVDVKPGPVAGCLMDLNDGQHLFFYFGYTQIQHNTFQNQLEERPDSSDFRFRPLGPSELRSGGDYQVARKR